MGRLHKCFSDEEATEAGGTQVADGLRVADAALADEDGTRRGSAVYFGGISAIAESLLQSVAGEIVLLPALPVEWETGHIHGLRAKGGFGVDIEWENSRLSSAVITSDFGGECRLRTNCIVSVVCKGESVGSRIEDGAVIFDTVPGAVYTIKC